MPGKGREEEGGEEREKKNMRRREGVGRKEGRKFLCLGRGGRRREGRREGERSHMVYLCWRVLYLWVTNHSSLLSLSPLFFFERWFYDSTYS